MSTTQWLGADDGQTLINAREIIRLDRDGDDWLASLRGGEQIWLDESPLKGHAVANQNPDLRLLCVSRIDDETVSVVESPIVSWLVDPFFNGAECKPVPLAGCGLWPGSCGNYCLAVCEVSSGRCWTDCDAFDSRAACIDALRREFKDWHKTMIDKPSPGDPTCPPPA